MMAKNIDGVYSADPRNNPNATKYDELTFSELLSKHLKVIDAAAAALCEDNNLPVLIFELGDGSGLFRALSGENVGTVLHQ